MRLGPLAQRAGLFHNNATPTLFRFGPVTQAADHVYHLVRALLAARGADDAGIISGAGQALLQAHFSDADDRLCDALVAEAEHNGVAPLLAPMVAACADRSPAFGRLDRSFAALAHRHRRAAAVREAAVDELLGAYAAAGVPVLLLKGAALAHLIYPSPALRPMVDIDLLVDAADARTAAAVARKLGFVFAPAYESRFAGRMHHLPVANVKRANFHIKLEIHTDAIAADLGGSLTMASLMDGPQPVVRPGGPQGHALGHTDMLRHLARHAFVPVNRVRLIHLYDLWRYQAKFRDAIDWPALCALSPSVGVALDLVSACFVDGGPSDAGRGMLPLADIATLNGFSVKLDALFNPPAWWMRGFYGIAPGKSLLACRLLTHPAMMSRWIAKRLLVGLAGARPVFDLDELGHNDQVARIGR